MIRGAKSAEQSQEDSVTQNRTVALLDHRQERLLDLPEKCIHLAEPVSIGRDVLRKGPGVAEIHQEGNLLFIQAQEVLIVDRG